MLFCLTVDLYELSDKIPPIFQRAKGAPSRGCLRLARQLADVATRLVIRRSMEDSLRGLDPAFDGVLRRDPRYPGRSEYYQDRHKRWAFHCGADGHDLLTRLLRAATPVVGRPTECSRTTLDRALPSCSRLDPSRPPSFASLVLLNGRESSR